MKNSRAVQSATNRGNHVDRLVEVIDLHEQTDREYEENSFLPSASSIIINVSEATLTALLSPIFMWQWLLEHNYFLKLSKIILEVALELLMLIVFAGVSIMTAAVLIYEEAYNDAHSKKMMLKSLIIDEKAGKLWAKQNNYQKNVKSTTQ